MFFAKRSTSRTIPRVDAAEKISGRAQYLADLKLEGMLHAVTYRSSRPRARILSIRLPDLPPGYWIVDRRDVPGRNRVRMATDDEPFFAEEEVRYLGEPILLVVGPERDRLREILSVIEVTYQDLDPVFTMEEAEKRTDGCFVRYQVEKGDPDKAFAAAAQVFEEEFRTGFQEHVYLEPQGVTGLYRDGRVTIYGSMQCPYYVKTALAECLGWSPERIRVVQTTTGGGFGGKEDYPSLLAGQAACAAIKTGRPVRLVLDRGEDISVTTKRHPSRVRFRTALDEGGEILGMEAEILLDGGAYCGLSNVVLQRALFAATGVYAIPNVRAIGKVMATNNIPSGAFRGFGSPQAFFAIEMHMHHLALRAGRDPLRFKMGHRVKQGGATLTGGVFHHPVMLPEMVRAVERMSGYRRRHRRYRRQAAGRDARPWKGIGISLFNHGCGFTGSGERDHIKARVGLKKRADGTVEILASSVEMGQGPQTSLRRIVADTLGIPWEQVLFDLPDTDRVPDSGPTVASRTIMVVGYLLQEAARELKRSWDRGPELEVRRDYRQPDFMVWDQESFRGDAYAAFSWGVNAVEVEIDPVTFELKVTGVWGAYDVGRPIDEQLLRGQVEGGVAQGLGWATMEKMEAREGRILQANLTDYIIPTSRDLPVTCFRLLDNPFPFGPSGAKGAGELPFVGVAPALAAAVEQAIGSGVHRIPVTPESILEWMSHGA